MSGSWLPAFVWFVVFGVPCVAIARKAGLPLWWAVPAVVPLYGAAVVLWIVAFLPWPVAGTLKGAK